MERTTLSQWCQDTGVTAIGKAVRENTNGYLFITFLRGSTAENLYFSKAASQKVAAGEETTPLLEELYVVHTQNALGEPRVKLSLGGESNYIDVASLWG